MARVTRAPVVPVQTHPHGTARVPPSVVALGTSTGGPKGQAIKREGGLTVGQDAASCTVYGCLDPARKAASWQRVVSLTQMPEQILQATHYQRRACRFAQAQEYRLPPEPASPFASGTLPRMASPIRTIRPAAAHSVSPHFPH